MDILIREATSEDLTAIDAFDVFSGNRGPEILAGEIVVAICDGEVAAYMMHNRRFYQRPFIWLLCVKERYQRGGIASKLLGWAEAYYQKDVALFSSTESDNNAMIGLFAKRGYLPSGSIENIQKTSELVFCRPSDKE
ncbi:MAG: GNAT family N-acetyltransferase [Bacteroidetes bacterium]|nr:GNAT family N-acetyltransferase [Bacteroidota bacterium]